jgi:hypothetical protein
LRELATKVRRVGQVRLGRRPTFLANTRAKEGGPALAKPRLSHPTSLWPRQYPTGELSYGGSAE